MKYGVRDKRVCPNRIPLADQYIQRFEGGIWYRCFMPGIFGHMVSYCICSTDKTLDLFIMSMTVSVQS